MNTMGKILVLLNLVLAVLTGGFLLIDYAARTNWNEEAERRKGLAKVSEADALALKEIAVKALAEKKRANEDLDRLLSTSKDIENRLKHQLQNVLAELEQVKEERNKAILNAKAAQEEAARRQEEVVILGKVIKDRQATIAKLQEEMNLVRTELLSQKEKARVFQGRAEAALAQLRAALIKIHDLETGGSGGTMVVDQRQKQSPNYQNPPQADVKGSIMKVVADDPRLVQISIGSDHGVKKDNTLEVYRLKPRAEYLGRLLVVEVHHHNSIARLIRTPGERPPVLRAGDEVASKIQ
jgi:hypothetical protein